MRLVRICIHDTDRIAKILDYSINTISNYKARVKSKSLVSNEEFEKKVMEIHAVLLLLEMTKIWAVNNKGICPAVLLSLTLLLGFISPPPLNNNQARQSAPTESVSRRSSSPRRFVIYAFLKKHFPALFFLSSHEIVTRLLLYERSVRVEHSENLNPEAFAYRLEMQLLTLTLNNSKSSDSYVLRG